MTAAAADVVVGPDRFNALLEDADRCLQRGRPEEALPWWRRAETVARTRIESGDADAATWIRRLADARTAYKVCSRWSDVVQWCPELRPVLAVVRWSAEDPETAFGLVERLWEAAHGEAVQADAEDDDERIAAVRAEFAELLAAGLLARDGGR